MLENSLGNLAIDMCEQRIPRSAITVICGSIRMPRVALLDTGAGVCHMTFGLWKRLGLDKACFESNQSLMKQMGFKSKEDFTFENLPLERATTKLGDENEIITYLSRVDTLILGKEKVGSKPIRLNNITVKVMDSIEDNFIVGMNVLLYLNISYQANSSKAMMRISLERAGLDWLEKDRLEGKANSMVESFNYLQEADCGKADTEVFERSTTFDKRN